MHVLVTGGAGFIGSHLVDRLLQEDKRVTVVDNFDSFYHRSIKERNIAEQLKHTGYILKEVDICDFEKLKTELRGDYDAIVHLAAKAGVRPSRQDPVAYQKVNVQGTQNLLEFAREKKIKQFVFASSSSVMGSIQIRLGAKPTKYCCRLALMRRPRLLENCWDMSTVIYMVLGFWPYAFLRFMVRGNGPIWQ